MPHLTPVQTSRQALCNGREIETRRYLFNNGRLIDFDEAVWHMDKTLFRRARDKIDVARWWQEIEEDRRRSADQGVHLKIPLGEPQWFLDVFREYRALHLERYGVEFDPPVSTVEPHPEELAHWNRCVDSLRDPQDRIPDHRA